MSWIQDLNIPAGLESLFWQIFRPQTIPDIVSLVTQTKTTQKRTYGNLVARSFFVMWQSLYDSFIAARRARWTAYWLTLPFGSHSGAGGWPGSGFSAFVFVNAPRYKQGLDLLLDPPGYIPPGTELLINGDFTGGYSPWAKGTQWLYDSNQMKISFSTPPQSDLWQDNLPLIYQNTYHLKFDIKMGPRSVPRHGVAKIYLGAYYTLVDTIDLSGFPDNSWQTIDRDIVSNTDSPPAGAHILNFRLDELNPVYPYYTYVDNFSLKST
jgi:hypothetical protein